MRQLHYRRARIIVPMLRARASKQIYRRQRKQNNQLDSHRGSRIWMKTSITVRKNNVRGGFGIR